MIVIHYIKNNFFPSPIEAFGDDGQRSGGRGKDWQAIGKQSASNGKGQKIRANRNIKTMPKIPVALECSNQENAVSC